MLMWIVVVLCYVCASAQLSVAGMLEVMSFIKLTTSCNARLITEVFGKNCSTFFLFAKFEFGKSFRFRNKNNNNNKNNELLF